MTRFATNVRRVAGAELAAALVLFELDVWVLRGSEAPLGHSIVIGLGALLLLSSLSRRGEPRRAQFGFGSPRAWLETMGLTLLGAGCVMALALAQPNGLDGTTRPLLPRLPVLIGVAFGQQVSLQLFLFPVVSEALGGRRVGGFLAAALFGALHLPNSLLVAATALAGAGWIGLFARHRVLLPLIVSHLLLAICLEVALPETAHLEMRVGRAALEAVLRAN